MVKSMASQGVPGALQARYAHLRHKLVVGGLSDNLNPPKPGGPALQIADRCSAGRKQPTTRR
jgi:hypothetical protein